jgi:hypothetical protein
MFVQGRKTGCRASLDYTFRDMRVAYLENDLIRVGVLVDKGADIFELAYKPRDIDVLWHSPIPLRKPFVATSASPEGAFHDYFYGGWQEVLPSAGWPKSPYLGAYQGLHGEVSLLPFEARILDDSNDLVTVEVEVRLYRSPLHLVRRMRLKRDVAALFIDERLENEAPVEFAIMWGHHPSFAAPFLDETCVVRTKATGIEVNAFHPNGLWVPGHGYKFPLAPNRRNGKLEDVTRVRPRTIGSADGMCFTGLEEGWFGVTSERLGLGIGMAWDAKLFPFLWMWQEYGGHNDYPWYGRTYNIALEPFTSWPPSGITTAIENGTALTLRPNETIETSMVAVFYEGDVSKVLPDGNVQR